MALLVNFSNQLKSDRLKNKIQINKPIYGANMTDEPTDHDMISGSDEKFMQSDVERAQMTGAMGSQVQASSEGDHLALPVIHPDTENTPFSRIELEDIGRMRTFVERCLRNLGINPETFSKNESSILAQTLEDTERYRIRADKESESMSDEENESTDRIDYKDTALNAWLVRVCGVTIDELAEAQGFKIQWGSAKPSDVPWGGWFDSNISHKVWDKAPEHKGAKFKDIITGKEYVVNNEEEKLAMFKEIKRHPIEVVDTGVPEDKVLLYSFNTPDERAKLQNHPAVLRVREKREREKELVARKDMAERGMSPKEIRDELDQRSGRIYGGDSKS